MGSSEELRGVLGFFAVEVFVVSDAFLFLAASFPVVFVFFTSDAEGSVIVFILKDFAPAVMEDECGAVFSSSSDTVGWRILIHVICLVFSMKSNV